MKHIVVLGSTNTDMVVTGQKIPVPGETVTGGRFLMNPGGKGANQAVAVARLASEDTRCVFIAKVGDDLFGSDSRARFESDGIVPRLIVDPETPSGVAVIMVDAQGQNCISVALGANGTLVPADVEPHRAEIESASALLMQLETPLETVLYAAKAAHAKGVPVILNPAPARELPAELYAQLDWITPNETEAELLTGVKVVDEASAAAAAKSAGRKKRRGKRSAPTKRNPASSRHCKRPTRSAPSKRPRPPPQSAKRKSLPSPMQSPRSASAWRRSCTRSGWPT